MQQVEPEIRSKIEAGDVSELIEKAARQPGVHELMTVYEKWRLFDDSCRPFRQIMGMIRVVSLSNTSGPAIREI
jgi:hypothetical protein